MAPSDGFIEQDPGGIITAWSAECEQIFGWSRDEAIGMRFHLLIPERNRARHDRALDSFVTSPGRPIERQEVTAVHKDGREFRAEFAISTETRGDEMRIVAVVRPVTPDARAEAAFRQGERYRAILDQIQDGCTVVDLRGHSTTRSAASSACRASRFSAGASATRRTRFATRARSRSSTPSTARARRSPTSIR
jgi:PAS domain S-box-containing protein